MKYAAFDITHGEDDAVLHCERANGDRVTVLLENGEPLVRKHPTDVTLAQVVRSDGTVIVDDVVRVRPGGHGARRALLMRRVGGTRP